MVRVRSPAALRLATIRVRIASTAPSRPLGAPRARPDCAGRAALTASRGWDLPCGAGPAGPSGPLRRPGPGRGDVAGQPGAVTAGPLDPDQAHGSEPAQPAQQAGVASRGGRELPTPSSRRRNRARRRHAYRRECPRARDGACFFYDGHCHPFLRLRDGTHPLAVGPVNPGLLHRLGRWGHRRWVPKPGARPTDRLAGQPGRREPNRRSGRDPGSDPTPVSSQNRGTGPEALSTSSLPIPCGR